MPALRARWVLPITGPPIRDGVVVIEGGRIARVGSEPSGTGAALEDLGDVAILPGLINAHCHLDYTCLRGTIPRGGDFASWIACINERKRGLTPADYQASVQRGVEESLRLGTTGILNIESCPEVLLSPPPTPARVWWCLELMDVREPAQVVLDRAQGWLGQPHVGLSPHAPYTASLDLYRQASTLAAAHRIPFTTHLAETRAEYDMFASRSGSLYELLARLGRPDADLDGAPPFSRLVRAGVLPQGAVLVHMNHLSKADWDAFLPRATKFSVVHCPRCHAWFDRPHFSIERFLKSGTNVCLGTDSLASNESLDMFAEMRVLLQTHPSLSPAAVLRMATTNGARALGMSGHLGEIRCGALADLVVKRIGADATDPEASVLFDERPPERVMLGGDWQSERTSA